MAPAVMDMGRAMDLTLADPMRIPLHTLQRPVDTTIPATDTMVRTLGCIQGSDGAGVYTDAGTTGGGVGGIADTDVTQALLEA
jgi:hypothetical protein